MSEPVHLQLFHDALCAWCAVAVERLLALEHDFGDLVDLSFRPYPLRPSEALLPQPEATKISRHLRRAAREPEGGGMVADLWTGEDRPLSSKPPLVALEAALIQGREAQRALLRKLHEAGLRRGINVARRDVLLEIASAVGLDMRRFTEALDSPAIARAVELSHGDAVARGIRAVPALSIGDEWMLTGLRPLAQYREVVRGWMQQHSAHPLARVIH
jgi:predicted DsbA family dithiol-disulfide isomerase